MRILSWLWAIGWVAFYFSASSQILTFFCYIQKIVCVIMLQDVTVNNQMRDGKENEVPPPISLDFKKKTQKPRPNTDRTNLSGSGVKQTVGPEMISLLEKKKQYSMALREKNLVKKGRQSSEGAKSSGNILTLHSDDNQSEYYSIKGQEPLKKTEKKESVVKLFTDLNTKEKIEPLKNVQSQIKEVKKDLRPKCRDSRRDKSKIQRVETCEPIESAFQSNISLMSINNNFNTNERMSIDMSMLGKLNDISKIELRTPTFQVCSREIDETIEPSQEDEKEIEQLKKHNATFKKELYNFRRENGTVKRQAEELKKQLAILQERNDFLEGQNADQIRLVELLQAKNCSSLVVSPENSQKSNTSPSTNDGKLKQILASYENDLFQATSLNKKLQFRNYMLQKRLADETEIHKKQMAKEIASWKERYIRARNQNMRMKDSRGHMLFDMSISRDD